MIVFSGTRFFISKKLFFQNFPKYPIKEKLTIGDPAYRLLRLILLSTDLQSCVNCMSKLVLSVSGPSGQAALIQLLKETHTAHDISFLPNFLAKAFGTNCEKKSLLNNVSVLVEDLPESSSNYDSGRNLLAQQVRKFLTVNISMILQFLIRNQDMSKSALEGTVFLKDFSNIFSIFLA